MTNITKFKKIIALSLLITLIPAQSQAAWYDNLWSSVKTNAVAIASVAVSAATIFGLMWWKTSKASDAQSKEIKQLEEEKRQATAKALFNKQNRESESDSSSSNHSDDSDDSRGNELAQAQQKLAATQAKLALERRLKEKANDRARKAKLRPASARSSILRYQGSNRPASAKDSQPSKNDAPQPIPVNVYKLRNANNRLKRAVLQERASHALLREQVAGLAHENAQLRAENAAVILAAQQIEQDNDGLQSAVEKLVLENEQLRLRAQRNQIQANIEIAPATNDAGTQTAASGDTPDHAQLAELEAKYKAEIATLKEKLHAYIPHQQKMVGLALNVESARHEAEKLRRENDGHRKLNSQLSARLKPATNAPALSATTRVATASASPRSSAANAHPHTAAAGVVAKTDDERTATRKTKRAAENAAGAAGAPQATAAPKPSAGTPAASPSKTPLVAAAAASAVSKIADAKQREESGGDVKADVEKNAAIIERTAKAWLQKYETLKETEKTARILKSYREAFATLSHEITGILATPSLEQRVSTRLLAIQTNCNAKLETINTLLKQLSESVEKLIVNEQPNAASRESNSLLQLKSEIDGFSQRIKADLEKASTKELEEDLVALETHLKAINNIQQELASYLVEGEDPKAVFELYENNYSGTGVDPKKAYEELVILNIFESKTINDLKQMSHAQLHTAIIARMGLMADKNSAEFKKLRQLAWTFENQVNKERYDAYISGNSMPGITKAIRQEYATKIDAIIAQIYAKKEAIRKMLHSLNADDDWVNMDVVTTRKKKGASQEPEPSVSFSDGYKPSAAAAQSAAAGEQAGWTSSFVALTSEFASRIKAKIVGSAAANNRMSISPQPAPTPLAIAVQPNAHAPEPIVRTATPMAQLKDLSPDAAAGIKAAAATGGGAAAGK